MGRRWKHVWHFGVLKGHGSDETALSRLMMLLISNERRETGLGQHAMTFGRFNDVKHLARVILYGLCCEKNDSTRLKLYTSKVISQEAKDVPCFKALLPHELESSLELQYVTSTALLFG